MMYRPTIHIQVLVDRYRGWKFMPMAMMATMASTPITEGHAHGGVAAIHQQAEDDGNDDEEDGDHGHASLGWWRRRC